MDDEEDMWDIVRQLEAEQQQHASTKGGAEAATRKKSMENTDGTGTEPATVVSPAAEGTKDTVSPTGVQEAPRPTNDEGWDEMYL